jgi:hypothetical protein
VNVPTLTLRDILDTANAPLFIHYLSLDTEGSEYRILASSVLEKYEFGYITVEHNWEEPKRSQIKNLLTSRGYTFYRTNEQDDDYIHPTVFKATLMTEEGRSRATGGASLAITTPTNGAVVR